MAIKSTLIVFVYALIFSSAVIHNKKKPAVQGTWVYSAKDNLGQLRAFRKLHEDEEVPSSVDICIINGNHTYEWYQVSAKNSFDLLNGRWTLENDLIVFDPYRVNVNTLKANTHKMNEGILYFIQE